MSEKMTIDFGEATSRPSLHESIEKVGAWALKMQEQDAMFQRMAQTLLVPDQTLAVDVKAIRKAVDEYHPDPIIPEDYFEKTQEYQQKSLEMLQSINENTANLYAMVELINKSNENQEELLEILSEVLAIATAKSKKEAETLFAKAMKKLTATTDNVETMMKVMGWATTIINAVDGMLP